MGILAGKCAFISHSANGLGFLIAAVLCEQGAAVTLHHVSEVASLAAGERLKSLVPDAKVSCVSGDLSVPTSREKVLGTMAKVDVLVGHSVDFRALAFSDVDQAQSSLNVRQQDDLVCELVGDLYQLGRLQADAKIYLVSYSDSPAYSDELRKALSTSEKLMLATVPVGDLSVEPAADVVKAEMLRTGVFCSEALDLLLSDHRPIAIQSAMKRAVEISLMIAGGGAE